MLMSAEDDLCYYCCRPSDHDCPQAIDDRPVMCLLLSLPWCTIPPFFISCSIVYFLFSALCTHHVFLLLNVAKQVIRHGVPHSVVPSVLVQRFAHNSLHLFLHLSGRFRFLGQLRGHELVFRRMAY